jgi:zinc transport system substrate-binding protein
MVVGGTSPHTYEPKPLQMREISRANLYLAIGVEFEKHWLQRFQNQNSRLKIVDISKNIEKVGNNPHIWLSPILVKEIAKNIFDALSEIDTQNVEFYKKNLDNYLKQLERLDTQIRSILKDTPKGSSFMVFHPAWGYFAREYGLRELAVEIDGKSPKPRELIEIIKRGKEAKVKAIFTQPEFSDKSAQIIAKELNIAVLKLSPLAQDWADNLLKLAKALAQCP